MRTQSSLILVLACAAAVSGCRQERPSTETFNWKGPVTTGSWLRLRNVSGDFDIREGTGDSAEIRLVIERSSSYAPEASVKVLQTADGVLACVLYGDDNSCGATEYRGGNTTKSGFLPFMRGRTSVEGTILLPRGVKLDAESTNGDITVSSIAADLIVSTVNGDVEVRGTRGAVKLTTTNGDIALGVASLGSALGIETTNGDVTIDVPTTLNAALSMRTTNGELDLRLPGNVATKTAKQILATLGTGGSPIDITTTNGDITLRPSGNP